MSLNIKGSKIYPVIFIILLILQCESKERFYRPDLPEQICAIGLIDVDDTLSYDVCQDQFPNCYTCEVDSTISSKMIFFEKSYQTDYSDGSSDMFREFNFKISDDKKDIFFYNSNEPRRNPSIKIPADLKFESGKKYLFNASVKEAPDILAECTVPDLPPELFLESLKTGINIIDLPLKGCYYWQPDEDIFGPPLKEDTTAYTRRFAEIEFSFSNTKPESYYTFFIIGSPLGTLLESDYSPGFQESNFFNFELLETNTDGFFHKYKGGQTVQQYCEEFDGSFSYDLQCMTDTLYSYFIDGSKIPGGTCIIKIYVQWDNVQYIPSFIKYFRVRLMSLPKEAYLFYKSLYTYKMERDDPFGDLININGNIVGGNGVIALCRSRDLIVYTGQTGGMYNPYF